MQSRPITCSGGVLATTVLYVAFFGGTVTAIQERYLNRWIAHIPDGAATAEQLILKHGFTYIGQIGSLSGYYAFNHSRVSKRSPKPSDVDAQLSDEPLVLWVEQQIVLNRVKRMIKMNDPFWKEQWYMNGEDRTTRGMGIAEAWQSGYTGSGVVVAIVDDGMEKLHPDLNTNYDAEASHDFTDEQTDTTPQHERDGQENTNEHGTYCARVVAAVANNSIGCVGVAPKSRIGGIRMLDGEITDEIEGKALSYKRDYIDIYCLPWGPADDGVFVDGPGRLAKDVLMQGGLQGRDGKGSIFVLASGNGGEAGDSCAKDGYVNSIYTIAITATSDEGTKPRYTKECPAILATAYSSGKARQQMTSTDLNGAESIVLTGTSAAASLASGILALALQANDRLTWRDVQHIIVMTSIKDSLKDAKWKKNGMGREVSHRYGFGMLDADSIVRKALEWTRVPLQHVCRNKVKNRKLTGNSVTLTLESNGCCEDTSSHVRYLEHVVLKMSLRNSLPGNLQINLISPMGTQVHFLDDRVGVYNTYDTQQWKFMSVHSWGENPSGLWTVRLRNLESIIGNKDEVKEAELIMYGTSTCPHGCDSSDETSRPFCSTTHESQEADSEFDLSIDLSN